MPRRKRLLPRAPKILPRTPSLKRTMRKPVRQVKRAMLLTPPRIPRDRKIYGYGDGPGDGGGE